MRVIVAQDILETNADLASEIRRFLTDKKIAMVNIIGGPGAGKTAILEKTLHLLQKEGVKAAVIEADLYTDLDARRLEPLVDVVQINTKGACHVDATLIQEALKHLPLDGIDLILIENVGNLVCPAEFDLGEDAKVAVLSVTEGNDKPPKYPLVFLEAEAVLLTKTDLLPYVNFDLEDFKEKLQHINDRLQVYYTSAVKEEGIKEWTAWLKEKTKQKKLR